VGANFGVMSVHMSRSAPAGAVHAFEPNPTTFKAMRANMKINRCYNVRCVQAAVSSTVGQGGFTDTSDPGTNKIDGSSEMTVPLTTIDHYLEENSIPAIDFIKIDVEGAEIAVLEGARVALKRGVIKRGMIEVCPGTLAQFGNTAPEIFDLLSGAGYELFWLDAPQHPLSSADLRKLSNQFLGNAGFALRGAR
jgi:FkbM family methyltransferase